MKLSEFIKPLLENSAADCFMAMDNKGLFTDGWKMHKGHCKKPSELHAFLQK